jgi:sulfate permease, SulP family
MLVQGSAMSVEAVVRRFFRSCSEVTYIFSSPIGVSLTEGQGRLYSNHRYREEPQVMRAYPGWAHFLPKSYTILREGYSKRDGVHDILAGLTVGIVAFPLAMAFAIASGVTPQQGLFTAIIAGFLISALGGSRYQIGGPTGAFVVIIYGIVQRHGYDGLVVATLMAGGILILLGIFRIGTLIKYIPYPVTTGFTAGIALIIAASQVKDFLGLHLDKVPADFLGKVAAFSKTIDTVSPYSIAVGLGSLAVILLFRRFAPRIPGPIVAVILSSAVVWAFHLPVDTIGTRFGAIPNMLPAPHWPEVHLSMVRELLPDAFTIALLAAIESLLCAVVADGMSGDRHRSNLELVAQGTASIVSVMFSGIPATGAIARTATNIRSGAFSPLAGIWHAVFVLLFMFSLAPLVSSIPLTCLAAILFVVAWNMSEIGHFIALFRAPRSDIAVLLATFLLTVLVDLNLAVQVGVVMAALLFMRRMAEVTELRAVEIDEELEDDRNRDPDATSTKRLPPSCEVYEIDGPFFFGVADKLKDTLTIMERPPAVLLLRLRRVPAVDATGLHALDEFAAKCRRQGTVVVLSEVGAQPLKALTRSGLDEAIGPQNVHATFRDAQRRAWELVTAKRPAAEARKMPREAPAP